jgi:MFS family permease
MYTLPDGLTFSTLQISAAVAGMAGGPLILVPLTYALGRSSIIWWSLIACMCCGIWGALMTGKGDYLPFVLSRFFAGVFGSVPSILGAGVLTDIFFLHERGRAFSTFSLSFLMGTVAGPTFGGFIVQHVYWANELWWTVGLQGLIIILGACDLSVSFKR